MGASNSSKISINSKDIEYNINPEELEIIKDNKVYNFKISLDTLNRINISVSFILNDSFKLYEINPQQNQELDKFDSPEEIYQDIIKEIKNENFEIIQQDNIEETVLLKLIINKELKEIKLFHIFINDEDKLDILTKNYISLQKKYIELKDEKKNSKNQNEVMDIEGEQENNSFYNSDNDDFYFNHNNHFNNIHNNNEFTNTNYWNPDDSHILLDISTVFF